MTQKSFFSALAFTLMLFFAGNLQAQKYFSRAVKVSFDATTKSSPEKISAVSNSGTLVIDKATGAVQTAVLLKGFLFEKALMQEHFNENYVESSKYPKAEFKGKMDNPAAVDYSKDGVYTVNLLGSMNLHGVSKELKTPATITVKDGKISAKTSFLLPFADYKIDIPSVVADKVAKQASIEVVSNLELLK
ncbi:MAG: YceI family protein [Bacteroidetes bacterium]|nr:YceI family protein [Bacteroidota bacterium]